MTKDNPIEINEYGELVNPDQPLDEEIDTNEILEDAEELEQIPSERDPTAGEITAEATSWENRINQYSAAVL